MFLRDSRDYGNSLHPARQVVLGRIVRILNVNVNYFSTYQTSCFAPLQTRVGTTYRQDWIPPALSAALISNQMSFESISSFDRRLPADIPA